MNEFWFNFIVQTIGIIGGIVCIISFQIKNNKTFLIFQLVSTLLFVVQFGLLKAWSGMLLNIVGAFRAIFFAFKNEKKIKLNFVIGIFFCLACSSCAVIAVCCFKELWYISLIIGLAQVVGTIAIMTNDPIKIRILQLAIVSPCWLFNNIFYFSIGGIVTECCNIISTIVALIRFKSQEKKKKTTDESSN